MTVVSGRWPERSTRRERVVTALVETLRIEPSIVERAEHLAIRTGKPVEQVLNQLGVVSDEALAQAYAKGAGCRVWDPDVEPYRGDVDLALNHQYLIEHRFLLLSLSDASVLIAACDPLDDEGLAGLAFASGKTVAVRVASPSDYRRAVGEAASPAHLPSAPPDDQRLELEVQRVTELGGESNAARLLTVVLQAAVARQASDVHFEPRRHDLQVRLRVDGRLTAYQIASSDLAVAVVSRIKVLSGLDLGERRLPQDGRATFVVEGRAVETRVSIVPTVFGEAVVLRILDRVGLQFDLDALGVAGPEAAILARAVRAAHGIFLVSGPTGSGKTTTLYALLNMLARSEKKILSIEDPVEHHFAHVNQVQIAPAIGLTFASALRAFLRQDPDIILVGEIRDHETAAVAIQAAMTGHLVIASVHANDAIRIVPRLLDMGVEPYQLAAGLLGAAAQRLVRQLCPSCRQQRPPTEAEFAFVAATGAVAIDSAWSPKGCTACAGSGFKGRIAIMEGFLATETLSAAVARGAPIEQLGREARLSGLRSLGEDGAQKAAAGLTTFAEVMAVVAA